MEIGDIVVDRLHIPRPGECERRGVVCFVGLPHPDDATIVVSVKWDNGRQTQIAKKAALDILDVVS